MNKKAQRRKRHRELLENSSLDQLKVIYCLGFFDTTVKDQFIIPEKENPYRQNYSLPKSTIEDYKWIKKHFKKLSVKVTADEFKEIIRTAVPEIDEEFLNSVAKKLDSYYVL